jgi:hypothetical protein
LTSGNNQGIRTQIALDEFQRLFDIIDSVALEVHKITF